MDPNQQEIVSYLSCLFANHQWEKDEFLIIRGVGEKGTRQEGVYAEDQAVQPGLFSITDLLFGSADRYRDHLVGMFVIPAVLNDSRAKEENVKLLPALILDLDEVPAQQAIEWLEEEIGSPSMVVASGGNNQYGPKLHAYYVFDEPLPPANVIPLVTNLSALIGADPSLIRRTQPIRIPGTIHQKNGEKNMVKLISWSSDTFSEEELRGKIMSVKPSPWASAKTTMPLYSAGVSFSSASSTDSNALLTTTIREGGVDGITRWDAFSKIAGHYLRVCREGAMSESEAFSAVCGWTLAHMSPPWPEERIQQEFTALLRREVGIRGPMPEMKTYQPIVSGINQSEGLKAWAAHKWVTSPVPQHTFLVDALVIKGEPHLFVAEGGAGKTFLIADLAMKVASWEEGDDTDWCGQKIKTGGTAVLILCEDSKTEMHIRLMELNKTGMIEKAGDRLIVLPMTAIGGSFPLTERNPKTGLSTTSQRWSEMLGLLKQLPDISLVAIDTLNSITHGDENSAVIISEMMREAHRVCGELGAALVINHHLRKSNEPIKSLEDLRDSIRGSTAIPSYFRINFGMFRANDWERRCKALQVKPNRHAIWRMGIAKCNIMGLIEDERTLVRVNGGVVDMTAQDPYSKADTSERVSWLVLASKIAAQDGHPFSMGTKGATNGFYARRSQLPDILMKLGPTELGKIFDAAVASKELVFCAAKGGQSTKWLDVPNGPYARNDSGEELSKGSWKIPDWSQWAYDSEQCICVQRKKEKNNEMVL
jgi:hypothetical protein